MANVIPFKARPKATPPTSNAPTEELCIYMDVLMHMRNHAICHNDMEFVSQLDPLIRQGLADGTVDADVHDEALKARIRDMLSSEQEFFYWKTQYAESVNE